MIRKAELSDLSGVTALALSLWPEHEEEELSEELAQLLGCTDAALFLAFSGDMPMGFAQCQLRRDYVEGTQSSPVGYLEGIFVQKDFRRAGYARLLLAACEVWAREQGCREFASDCELTNEESLAFHMKLGFREANRIICFTKTL